MIDVLLIRGAPGIGKSTVGRGLAETLGRGAVLEVDHFRAVQSGIDWESEWQHDVALDACLAAASRFAAAGVAPVIIVDTFCGGRIGVAQTALDGADLQHATVSLWLEAEQLRARLAAREHGLRHWPSSRGVNIEVREARFPSEALVDVTGLEPREVVGLVAEILTSAAVGCGHEVASQRPARCPRGSLLPTNPMAEPSQPASSPTATSLNRPD